MRNLIFLPLAAGVVLLSACVREPMSGDYRVERVGEIKGDCVFTGEDDVTKELSERVNVRVSPDGNTMTLVSGDKDEVTCPIKGNEFECILIDDVEDVEGARTTIKLTAIGDWINDREFDGTISYTRVCEGEACVDIVEAQPSCNAEWDFKGRLEAG